MQLRRCQRCRQCQGLVGFAAVRAIGLPISQVLGAVGKPALAFLDSLLVNGRLAWIFACVILDLHSIEQVRWVGGRREENMHACCVRALLLEVAYVHTHGKIILLIGRWQQVHARQ